MRKNGIASRAFMVMVFLFLYAPIFLLIIFSFNEKPGEFYGFHL